MVREYSLDTVTRTVCSHARTTESRLFAVLSEFLFKFERGSWPIVVYRKHLDLYDCHVARER